MKKLGLLIVTGGLLLLALGAIAHAEMEATQAPTVSAAIGKAAPDFTLTDVNGKTHKLSDYSGKVVVLEWVNFDCPFCKMHYSTGNMQKLQAAYTKKDIVWLSICSSASGKQGNWPPADLKKHITEVKALPTAYLIDDAGTVGKLYDAKTTPNMYVIDAKGVLRYAGALDDTPTTKAEDAKKANNYVRGALDAILSGKDVAVKTSTPYGCSIKYKEI